jgi:DNA-binding CsgD family transcriptional regulator
VALGGIATVDQLGLQRRKGVWCRCDAVDSLIVLGRSDEAEALLREAFALQPEGIDAVRAHGMRGALALRRGRLAEARTELLRARRLGAAVVDGHLALPVHRALIETLRWQGQWQAAVDVLLEVRRRAWSDGDAAYLIPVLAAAAGATADGALEARRARHAAEESRWTRLTAEFVEAADHATARPEVLLPPARVALATARAELARATGSGATSAWADTAAAWQELGDGYQAGCALLRQAECELADRRRAAAAGTLRAAHRAAINARAMHLLRAVEATAERARLPLGERVTPGPGSFHLSAREKEVLALLTLGRTDRQIGAELFISHRTVERHVSNILAKLNARTRAELTAIAYREGLVRGLAATTGPMARTAVPSPRRGS